MWRNKPRYSAPGILLLGVIAALLLAWWLSHVWFAVVAIVAGFIVLSVAIVWLARDGWRQTSPESLGSRGFRPGTVSGIGVMDPGLRREYAPILPSVLTRRKASNPALARRRGGPFGRHGKLFGRHGKARPKRPCSQAERTAPAGCHYHPRR